MHLVYDARHLCLPYSGLARYSLSLLSAILDLPETETPDRITVVLTPCVKRNEIYSSLLGRLYEDPRSHVVVVDETPFDSVLQIRMSSRIRSLKADHYFFPHYDAPLFTRVPFTCVIHDLMPLVTKGYIRRHVLIKRFYFWVRVLISLRKANTIVSVSRVTKADILRRFGRKFAGKLVAIKPGLPPRIPKAHQSPIKGRFLLYVGDRRPHKNLERLLCIFKVLRSTFDYTGPLVIAGPPKNHGLDVESYAQDLDLPVISLGAVSEEELAQLYCHTDAHFLVSNYEGFGLPSIEAARYGAKTILSNGGALTEAAQAGSLVIEADLDPVESAQRVHEYLQGPIRPSPEKTEATFNWLITAREVLSVLNTPHDP